MRKGILSPTIQMVLALFGVKGKAILSKTPKGGDMCTP